MQVVDDAQLIALARKPAGELFLPFRTISAFGPLLVLLCLLPALYAVMHSTTSDADALWGLRAMSYVPGEWPPSLLRSPEQGVERLLRWQPPLGSWVTAGAVEVAPWAGPAALSAVPYLATAASVALVLLVLRTIGTERFAFWGVVLTAGHAPLLVQASHMAPVALGIALGLAAFWGFLSHLEWGTRRATIKLILGGVSLGLCSLASGPLALGVFAALLLYVLGLRGESLSRRQYADPRPIRVWRGWPALRSLAWLALIALAAGGFWTANRLWHDGGAFLSSWLFGAVPADMAGAAEELRIAVVPATRPMLRRGVQWLLEAQGPLLPASLCGFVLAVHGVAVLQDEKPRRTMLFLVSWVTSGLLGWLLAARGTTVLPHVLEWWECYLSLGLTACGALFLEELALRRLRMHFAAVVLVSGVVVLWLGGRFFDSPLLFGMARVLLVALAGALVLVMISHLREDRGDAETRRQVMLSLLVVAVIAASVATGIASLRRESTDDVALAAFREDLPRSAPVTDATFLSDEDEVPLRLRLAVRSAWPEASIEMAGSWDAAMALALASTGDRGAALVVDWNRKNAPAVNLQVAGVEVTPVGSPQLFAGGPLRAYLVVPED